MRRPCSARIVRSEPPDHIHRRRQCLRPHFSEGNVDGVETRGWRQCQPPCRTHVLRFPLRIFAGRRFWCHAFNPTRRGWGTMPRRPSCFVLVSVASAGSEGWRVLLVLSTPWCKTRCGRRRESASTWRRQKSATRQVCDQECATCCKEWRGNGTHLPVGGVQECQWRSKASRFWARPPRICSQILAHLVRRAPDLNEPDPLGRRRASSLGPPGFLCGGEVDMLIAVYRPKGSGRVHQEARPRHVGVLEFYSARQSRGLGRRNEAHRHVANVFGRLGCPQCPSPQQGSQLGQLGWLLAHFPGASARCRTPLGRTVGAPDNAMFAFRRRGCQCPHRSGRV